MPAAKLFGEPSRLIQMYSIANMWIYFGMAKEKAETFWVSAENKIYTIIFSLFIVLVFPFSVTTVTISLLDSLYSKTFPNLRSPFSKNNIVSPLNKSKLAECNTSLLSLYLISFMAFKMRLVSTDKFFLFGYDCFTNR